MKDVNKKTAIKEEPLGPPASAPAGGFKVGGRHWLRNGKLVVILAVDRPHPEYPIVWMSESGDVDVCAADGRFHPGRRDHQSLQDIVGSVRGRPRKQNALAGPPGLRKG